MLGDAERGGKIPRFDKQGSGQEKQQPQQRHRSNRSRRMRVLWFYASHERDMLSLLDMLASARAPHQSECNRTGHPHIDDDSGAASMNEGVDAAGNDADDCNVGADRHDAPLFDMACFMEVIPGRPSRFMLPTATEILARHGVACVPFDSPEMVQAEADVGSDSKECQVKETMQGVHGGGDETTKESTREGVGERNEESTVPGAWQRTLQQVITYAGVRRKVLCSLPLCTDILCYLLWLGGVSLTRHFAFFRVLGPEVSHDHRCNRLASFLDSRVSGTVQSCRARPVLTLLDSPLPSIGPFRCGSPCELAAQPCRAILESERHLSCYESRSQLHMAHATTAAARLKLLRPVHVGRLPKQTAAMGQLKVTLTVNAVAVVRSQKRGVCLEIVTATMPAEEELR